jgi:lipoprotein NlpI
MREMDEQARRLLTPENDRQTRFAEFDAVVRPLRHPLLGEEIAMRRHERTLVVIERLLEAEVITAPEAAFFRGELFRVRGERGDDALAIEQFRAATAVDDAPKAAYRNLGFVLRRTGDRAGALEALRRYIELSPDANDRAMVDAYIQELTQ